MQDTFDDTLPLPADVESVFLEHAGDDLTACNWLEERDIDPARIIDRVGKIALIQYSLVWNPEVGRYDFVIHASHHVGPKHSALAVPVTEGGEFVDLLLVGDDCSFVMVCCRAPWLGRENLSDDAVRLHAHPLDWLEAGCTGVCHVALISRQALNELQAAGCIECNDIGTALEAWSWGFGANDTELSRFEINDTPDAINAYYEREVRWHAMRIATEMERSRTW